MNGTAIVTWARSGITQPRFVLKALMMLKM